MKKKNEKGFTLIELLAVIIILGVLLLIAIPAMTGIIEGAKKDSWVSTAKNYISQVRYSALQGDYALPGRSECTIVNVTKINLEQGDPTKSVYGQKWKTAYVAIINTPGTDGQDKYTYYFGGCDAENNSMGWTAENNMTRAGVLRRNSNCPVSASGNTIQDVTNGDNSSTTTCTCVNCP